ncbi:MAG TPA: succinylglutamate-semialdehyde dehydrogenase [Fibrobacteria bacterium]|nr:succinylglutamate-semialdehyde dehydrogenase [Fibrobacteria bacterium]
MSKGNRIGGAWRTAAGAEFHSTDPATGLPAWTGRESDAADVDAAVASARAAFPAWSALGPEKRAGYLRAYADWLQADLSGEAVVAVAIARETGKPMWECRQEVETMIAKVANSLEAFRERCAETSFPQAGFTAVKRFRPHGVAAVLGPFNLPGHLPHSHIVPALLAGNTVVFKPSELTPGVGEAAAEIWAAAGLPAGVLNLVQGGRSTGVSLASHPGLDGLFFTGSRAAGAALNRLFADHPGRILALELGGNNPLVVWDCADAEASAYLAAQSAYVTAGQRCVCARRLILPAGPEGDRHLDALLALLPRLRVGAPEDVPEPFLGPVISAAAAERLLEAQAALEKAGGRILVPMRKLARGRVEERSSAFLAPGLVDMTGARERPDEEFFGPLLQVIRVDSYDAAIGEANRTRFGLAAGLISDRRDLWDAFHLRIRAGVVNWNRQTTGASGKLPFGGVGESGNHRPSASYAADYCAYPVASLEAAAAKVPARLPPGIDP